MLEVASRLCGLHAQLMSSAELTLWARGREVGRLTGSAAFGAKIAQSSWGTILRPAAFSGRLCFGPSLGQRVRFARPDTWLAAAHPPVDPQAATAAVTRRFLAAYGPATHHDLARWWSGGGVSAARQWIASLGEEVSPVELDGVQAWMLTVHAREARDFAPDRSVRLLPGFDQYVVGASCHAERLLPGDLRSRVYRRKAGFRLSFWSMAVWRALGAMKLRAAASMSSSSHSSRLRYGCAARPGRKPSVWPRFSAAL
jgi:Winged helix DNA-binding domain